MTLEALKVDEIVSKLAICRDAISKNKLQESLPILCESLKEIHIIFYKFCRDSTSPLSMFWNFYTDMVLLLLRFIKAEREGNWEQHLQSTAEMLPHFFAMDRTNYSRWKPIYLADMCRLPENAHEVS